MNNRFLSVVLPFTLLCIIAGQSNACPNPKPIPIISGPNPRYVCKGAVITFDGSHSYDPDGGPIQGYTWAFLPMNEFYYTTSPFKTYIFNSADEYQVWLCVWDNEGQQSLNYDTCTVIVSTADIEFTLEDIGGGQVKISYTTNHDVLPRSIALSVLLSTGTVKGAGDVLQHDTAYNCFMDYAYNNPSYQLNTGHPLAKPDGPGVPNFGSVISNFSINMACFNDSGAPGPAATDLIKLQLHKGAGGSTTTTVTINEDTLRSSFAGRGLTTNLPQIKTVSSLPQ